MPANNDDKILALQQAVNKKREAIHKTERFAPITNMSLTVLGQNYNLNACSKEMLSFLYGLLKNVSAHALTPVFLGFDYGDWLKDIKGRYDYHTLAEEKQKLTALEKRLDAMLSSDKKTELEIEAITKQLLG